MDSCDKEKPWNESMAKENLMHRDKFVRNLVCGEQAAADDPNKFDIYEGNKNCDEERILLNKNEELESEREFTPLACDRQRLSKEKDLKRPVSDVSDKRERPRLPDLYLPPKKRLSYREEKADQDMAKKKTNDKQKSKNFGPSLTPTLPEDIAKRIDGMRGSEVQMVIEKKLSKTDISRGHNRLSMPSSQVLVRFLRDEEIRDIQTNEWKEKEFLLIEPGGEKLSTSVGFTRWDMKKDSGKGSSQYVLNKNWNHLVARNRLKSGMVLQVWSFRVNRELCFALVRLTDGQVGGREDDGDQASGSVSAAGF